MPVVITTIGGLLFGIAPSLWGQRQLQANALREGGRAIGDGTRIRRWGDALAVFRNVGDAKVSAAKSQIDIFALALDSYRLDNDVFPASAQGLDALRTLPTIGEPTRNWRGPYLRKTIPRDPWGRAYLYVSPGKT